MNTKEYMDKLVKDAKTSLRGWLKVELKRMAEKNPAFAEKYDPKEKLEELIEWITEGARSIAVNNCACLSEEQVRKMAMDWYMDGIGEERRKEREAEEKKRKEAWKRQQKRYEKMDQNAAEQRADYIAIKIAGIIERLAIPRLTHHPIKHQPALFEM